MDPPWVVGFQMLVPPVGGPQTPRLGRGRILGGMSSALQALPDALVRAPQAGAEDLAEPLRSRWSPSVYDDAHTLERAEIDQLLAAAQWAPSAGNSQPWPFFVCP